MNVFLDIETIPDPAFKQMFIDESVNNFKAPSGLSKKQALIDMNLDGEEKPQKFWTKEDTIKEWELSMAPKLAEDVGIEKWKKCSLDASFGQVVSIAYALDDNEVVSHTSRGFDDDAELLNWFFKSLMESMMADLKSGTICKPYFIGHYIGLFDLKFLFQRSVIQNIKPTFKLPFYGRHAQEFFDTNIAWCGYKDRISQDKLCKALGIEGKPGDIDGSKVFDFWQEGNYSRIQEYNVDDVEKNRMIYNRLNFIDQ